MTQNKKTVSVIIGLICFAFVISGIFVSLNSNIFELPAIRLVLGLSEVDLEDYYDELDEYTDMIDDASDEDREEFYDITGIELDDFTEMITNPSISDLLSLSTLVDNIDADEVDTSNFNLNYFDVTEDVKVGLAIVRAIIIAYGLFVALFSLLGALLKKIVFPILATVFSLGFFFALVSVIMGIVFIALSVIHAVLISQIKSTPVVPNNTAINA